jgi:hypothetical protein
MLWSEYRPGLPVYYRTKEGDTIPAITKELRWVRRNKVLSLRVLIDGDFLTGTPRRLVAIKNLELQK